MRWLIAFCLVVLTMIAWAQNPAPIREIRVEGNNIVTTDFILTSLRLKPGAVVRPADLTSDEDLLLSFGIFREVELTTSPTDTDAVDVVVRVVENPVVKEVRVYGNTVLSTETITNIVLAEQPVGEIYNMRRGRTIATAITDAYLEEGYRIQIEQVQPDRDSENTLTIGIVEPKLGKVKIVNDNPGKLRTKPYVFERILGAPERGEPLNETQFRRNIENLYGTGWFDNIVPRLDIGEDAGEFDVTLLVKERPTGLFNAGIALDPQSRLVGQISYSDSHFRGTGQSVGVVISQAAVSGGPSIDLAWSNDYLNQRGSSISVSAYTRVVYNFTGSGSNPFGGGGDRGFDERRTGFDINYTNPINDELLGQIGIQAENIKSLTNDSANQNARFVQQDGDLVVLKLGASRDTRIPRLDPYAGDLATIVIEPGYSNITKIGGNVGGIQDVLGQNFFLRTNLEYRRYWPLARTENAERLDAPIDQLIPTIAVRAKYGFISGTAPFFEQLFVGGPGSLRGYENQQFWGDRSFVATAEYRRPIERNFSVIAFADYGGAWGGYGEVDGFPQFRTPNLKLAYGLGVAFQAGPLGNIRLDYALNQDGGSKLHFTIGSGF